MGSVDEGKEDFYAELNIVPFIDVVLVLLVIFMLLASVLNRVSEVTLPEGQGVAATKVDHFSIAIKADGTIFIGEESVDVDELIGFLPKQAGRIEGQEIYLEVDNRVSFAYVYPVLQVLGQAGASKVSFVVAATGTKK